MPKRDNSPKFTQPDLPFTELPAAPAAPAAPAPKRRRNRPIHPICNDMAIRYAVYGSALFAFVRSSPDLWLLLESSMARLRSRKAYKLDPDGCSPLRRAHVLRYNRRSVFLALGRAALPRYVAATANPAPAFLEFPNRVITAFTAQCVRDYFRLYHGDPNYDRP